MGEMVGQGLVNGLVGMTPRVAGAASAIVAPVTNAANATSRTSFGIGSSGPGVGGRGESSGGGDTYHVQVDQHFTTDDPTAAGRQSARAIVDRLK
jgi:hypothetical protein